MSRQNILIPLKHILIYVHSQEPFPLASGKIMKCHLSIAHVLSQVASVLGPPFPVGEGDAPDIPVQPQGLCCWENQGQLCFTRRGLSSRTKWNMSLTDGKPVSSLCGELHGRGVWYKLIELVY